MAIQAAVERQRGGEGLDLGQSRAREAAANEAAGGVARRFSGGASGSPFG